MNTDKYRVKLTCSEQVPDQDLIVAADNDLDATEVATLQVADETRTFKNAWSNWNRIRRVGISRRNYGRV